MSNTDAKHERLSEVTGGDAEEVRFWRTQLNLASKAEESWRQTAENLQKRYRNEGDNAGVKLNIFWSNCQTLAPAVYSQTPRPDVRRRNIHEQDQIRIVGRQAATVLERALTYALDDYAFSSAMERVRDDGLITGRGVAREIYEFDEITRRDIQAMADPMTGTPTYYLDGRIIEPDFDEDGKPFVVQRVNERVICKHVFWSDYLQSPARCWEDCWWVAYRHTFTRDELTEEFGSAIGNKIPLTIEGDSSAAPEGRPVDPKSAFKRGEVWEVWNKRKRERIWIATGFNDRPVRKDKEPLSLRDFFPMARPYYTVPVTDSMVPVPEFDLYADQARELDDIQDRLCGLIEQLKVVTVSDADFVEMLAIAQAKDGDNIPVKRPDVTAGDLNGALWWYPLERIVPAIAELTRRAEMVKLQIYELTGITDLRRGSGTRERESATAQELKAGYGRVRMTPRSKPMAEFVRDTLRVKAEIMAEMFQPETLELHAGHAIDPAVIELLRNEKLRHTTIDIETDSTVAPDEQAEKAEAMEFTTLLTEYVSAVAPIVGQAPQLAPMFMALLKAATKPFKFSREVEDVIDQTADLIAQEAAKAPLPSERRAQDPRAMQAALQAPGAIQ